MIDILVSAFLLSVVLVGIHSFFGLEIIRRGIIFTDLAIGQMAALGAAVSLFFLDGNYMYLISLTFALSGGLLIAITARKRETHEAFIGLLYAFGIAGVYIILSKSPHGMEEFQRLIASDILFTPMKEIIKTAVIYAFIGIIIFLVYNKISGLFKDAVFFILFAITVTSSVKLAGVLIVFSLLLSPALISHKINKGFPIINAWIIGILINIIAISISYYFDFPTGYSLVFFHSLISLLIFNINIKKVKPIG